MQRKQARSTSTSTAEPVNNLLGRTGFEKDFLYRAEGKRAFKGEAKNIHWDKKAGGLAVTRLNAGKTVTAGYTSEIISCRFPATEFLPSWNIRLPVQGQGFRLFMRLYGEDSTRPSSWLMIGEGGSPPADPKAKTSAPGWGSTRIDYLDLRRPATAFQYRIDLFVPPQDDAARVPVIGRFCVHYSSPAAASKARPSAAPALAASARIRVPYRSQLTVEREELRNHICCPTSLAMVLQHNGIDRPTLDVCAEAYDSRYDIYGVWPRASHVAYQYGLQSWVHRFRSHTEVLNYLAAGHPIIASIRVGEGELRGARYPRSNGHIIVVTGIKNNGKYIVNDPASAGPKGAEIEYFADDMEKVWLDKGGVAILIKPETTK